MPNTLIFTKLPSAKNIQLNILDIIFNAVKYTQYVQKVLKRMLRGHVQHTGAYPEYALRTCLKNTQRCSKFIGRKLRV